MLGLFQSGFRVTESLVQNDRGVTATLHFAVSHLDPDLGQADGVSRIYIIENLCRVTDDEGACPVIPAPVGAAILRRS